MKSILLLIIGFLGGYLFQNLTTTPIVKIKKIQTIVEKDCPICKVQSKNINHNDKSQQLQRDIFSPEILMQQTLIAIDNANYNKALQNLEDLIGQPQDVYSPQKTINMVIDIVDLQLKSTQVIDIKINILTKAINILPNYVDFNYQLAQLFIKIKSYADANYQLSFLENSKNWHNKFIALKHKIELFKSLGDGIEIPLIKKHNSYHIKVSINQIPAIFILDTGASITTISDKFKTNYVKKPIIISTANGKIDAYTTKINLKTAILDNNNFLVAVLPKNKLPSGVDGLLGMDFLNAFNFFINYENSSLLLQPK